MDSRSWVLSFQKMILGLKGMEDPLGLCVGFSQVKEPSASVGIERRPHADATTSLPGGNEVAWQCGAPGIPIFLFN